MHLNKICSIYTTAKVLIINSMINFNDSIFLKCSFISKMISELLRRETSIDKKNKRRKRIGELNL